MRDETHSLGSPAGWAARPAAAGRLRQLDRRHHHVAAHHLEHRPLTSRAAVRAAGFDPDSGALTLELAEMLSGEEARRAAVEAGVIAEGEDLPNDFFIRGLGADRTGRLSAETQIRLQGYDSGGSPTLVEVDREGFAQAFAGGFTPPEWYGGEYVEATVVGDSVTTLQQVYLP